MEFPAITPEITPHSTWCSTWLPTNQRRWKRRLLDRTFCSRTANCSVSRARKTWRKSSLDGNLGEFFDLQKSATINIETYRFDLENWKKNCASRSLSIGSTQLSTVAVKILASVLTHISCVAVRAVSFGASASFGSARLSVRPPGSLRPRLRIGWSPKSQAVGSTVEKVSFEYLPLWDKSCFPPAFTYLRSPNRHVSRRPLPHGDRRRPARRQ